DLCFLFFSSRRRHTRFSRDWSSDVCSSDLLRQIVLLNQGLDQLVFLKNAELEFVKKFSEISSLEKLQVAIEMLEKTHYSVERNANPKILFLDLSLQLVLLFKYNTFPTGRS